MTPIELLAAKREEIFRIAAKHGARNVRGVNLVVRARQVQRATVVG